MNGDPDKRAPAIRTLAARRVDAIGLPSARLSKRPPRGHGSIDGLTEPDAGRFIVQPGQEK